jgi:polar amino acid transport system substrate-binding protein
VKAELKTYPDVLDILNAVRLGEADLGIAAITVTSQREGEFDFSHPVLSGSLQMMVLAQAEPNMIQQLFSALFSTDLLRLLGTVALMMLIPTHIIWYVERDKPDGLIDHSAYFPGIFEALWWTILALAAQADEMPKGLIGRVVALFWLFIGIIFISYFTAVITAAFTIEELQGDIQRLSDLQDRRVAVIADSEVVDYLQERNIQQVLEFAQPEAAYQALKAEQVDALVAPRPLLNYYASHDWKGSVQVVGTPFRERFYSIAMPKNSPYRKPINQAILTLQENGTYGEIYQRWFGVKPQD